MVIVTTSKEKILKLLLENKIELFSIRTISKKCSINYKSAYNAVLALNSEKLIQFKTTENTKFCTLTNNFSPLLFKVEFERKNEISQKKGFSTLLKILENICEDQIILLFGSYAKGLESKNSDIDLLIISDYEKKISSELELLPLDIHATYISRKEFLIMAKSREFSVVSEALKKNIILVGIETYYRLLKNVRY